MIDAHTREGRSGGGGKLLRSNDEEDECGEGRGAKRGFSWQLIAFKPFKKEKLPATFPGWIEPGVATDHRFPTWVLVD